MIDKFDAKTPLYLCKVCAEAYYTSAEAEKCERSAGPLQARVGQIVLINRGYGWYDGKPEWVVEKTGDHNGRPTHSFWYVITAITKGRPGFRPVPLWGDAEAHVWTYHMATRAMVKQGTNGWTRPKSHHWFDSKSLLEPPPIVIEEAKMLIGQQADSLL